MDKIYLIHHEGPVCLTRTGEVLTLLLIDTKIYYVTVQWNFCFNRHKSYFQYIMKREVDHVGKITLTFLCCLTTYPIEYMIVDIRIVKGIQRSLSRLDI